MARTADAHVGDWVYEVFELPTSALPDIHDKSLEDWEEVLPSATLDPHDFGAISSQEPGYVYGEPVPADVVAFRFFLAWHHGTQRLFFAQERYDAAYSSRLPAVPLTCCSFDHTELFIDGDHSGGLLFLDSQATRAEREVYDNVYAQAYLVVPEAEGPSKITMPLVPEEPPLSFPQWAVAPPYADAGGTRWGEPESLSSYEWYVTPWDELRGTPEGSTRTVLEAGRVIGFQLFVMDWDEALGSAYGGSQGIYTVSGARRPDIADNFVDAVLVPCFVEDCSKGVTSSVSPASWGRIKASLGSYR